MKKLTATQQQLLDHIVAGGSLYNDNFTSNTKLSTGSDLRALNSATVSAVHAVLIEMGYKYSRTGSWGIFDTITYIAPVVEATGIKHYLKDQDKDFINY